MNKTIMITGATDGIGLVTAKKLSKLGHHLIIHGRNPEKLAQVAQVLASTNAKISSYCADLSELAQVKQLADTVAANHSSIDVIINNAGIYKTNKPIASSGLDVRFVVNTIAPFLLTKLLFKNLAPSGRVVNLSSAAQAPIDLGLFSTKNQTINDMQAYAQSKLAIAIWSQQLAKQDAEHIYISVNPGSLLASKMVKQGFGVEGKDINIGADILIELALDAKHHSNSGKYFDNDIGRFSSLHPDANNPAKTETLMTVLTDLCQSYFT